MKLKVLRAIVRLVAILVMDDFVPSEGPPESLLHH